ncbi:MAG: nucleotide exchange factor GrpE [Nitrospiraceae bacterium]|nr:MAG: nucleotide exchange factor GrpE [Nitrospiraceae bacterium]
MTENQDTGPKGPEQNTGEEIEALNKSLSEANDKYVRLYAEFENYKRFASRQKEDQLKYANESLLKDLLTVIDHLELALQHSSDNETSGPLAEGVQLTLKEIKTTLEKYGLTGIDALNKPFDPSVHHAMSQIESEDAEDNTVVREFRKGYMFKDRVLRASLVGVAKKPSATKAGVSQDQAVTTEES